jgi:hypothetical protein
MSLTSGLSEEGHPLRQYFQHQFPRSDILRRSVVRSLPIRRVRTPVAPGRTIVQWDLLGQAIDYRLRAAFATPAVPAAVRFGVELCPDRIRSVGTQLVEAYLDQLMIGQPYERGRPWILSKRDESRLASLCFAMAWFEQFYRDRSVMTTSPLLKGGEPSDLDALLTRVPEHAIRDLDVQIRLAEASLGLLRAETAAEDCCGGPTFAGSEDVGCADADLKVGGMLLEIKAISRPQRLRTETLWQLAGYCLLDYDDAHRLNSVGLYLSRIGWIRSWTLVEFFQELGAKSSVSALRRDLAAFVTDSSSRSTGPEGV